MENKQETPEEVKKELHEGNDKLSQYYIDVPYLKGIAGVLEPRIIYGHDAVYQEEYGFSGYYLLIESKKTGNVHLRRGFDDNLEGGEMLIILEKNIPDSIKKTPALELLDTHKGLIAAGLPI